MDPHDAPSEAHLPTYLPTYLPTDTHARIPTVHTYTYTYMISGGSSGW